MEDDMNNYTIQYLRDLVNSNKFLSFRKYIKRKQRIKFINRIKWK